MSDSRGYSGNISYELLVMISYIVAPTREVQVLEHVLHPQSHISALAVAGIEPGRREVYVVSTTSRRVKSSNEYLMSLVYRLSTPNY